MITPLDSSLIQPVASSLMQPVVSSLINVISEKWVIRAENGQKGGFLPLLALSLMKKFLGKGVTKPKREYNNMDKNF